MGRNTHSGIDVGGQHICTNGTTDDGSGNYGDGSYDGGSDMSHYGDDGGGYGGNGGSYEPPQLPFQFYSVQQNADGGTTVCYLYPLGTVCVITAPRPVADPYDPPPVPLPAPDDDRPWYCRWFEIGCGNDVGPVNPPLPQPDDNPVIPPYIPPKPQPEDGRPYTKYGEGYEEEIQKCEAQYDVDHNQCQADYAMV